MIRISFTFPYDTRLSKNLQHVFTGGGRGNKWDAFVSDMPVKKPPILVNAAATTKLMGDIQTMARGECNRLKVKFEPRKIWVHIKVFKPDMKLDACNVVDMIVDGVKRGVGVDDNLYSGSWDWELVDDSEKRIEITVEQGEKP